MRYRRRRVCLNSNRRRVDTLSTYIRRRPVFELRSASGLQRTYVVHKYRINISAMSPAIDIDTLDDRFLD